MTKHGKKYLEAKEKIDIEKLYDPREALELVKDTSYTKFDSSVEVHMRMGLDPRQADQQLRDVVILPHGLGKTIRVLVFAQGEGAKNAQEAGADYVADDDDWIKKIEGGWADFDVAISTPDMMGKAGRLGKVLGPRGLMPNPKAGTVVPAGDLARAINESKAGRVEFRLDKTANVHVNHRQGLVQHRQALRQPGQLNERNPQGQTFRCQGLISQESHPDLNHGPRRKA